MRSNSYVYYSVVHTHLNVALPSVHLSPRSFFFRSFKYSWSLSRKDKSLAKSAKLSSSFSNASTWTSLSRCRSALYFRVRCVSTSTTTATKVHFRVGPVQLASLLVVVTTLLVVVVDVAALNVVVINVVFVTQMKTFALAGSFRSSQAFVDDAGQGAIFFVVDLRTNPAILKRIHLVALLPRFSQQFSSSLFLERQRRRLTVSSTGVTRPAIEHVVLGSSASS